MIMLYIYYKDWLEYYVHITSWIYDKIKNCLVLVNINIKIVYTLKIRK